MPHPHVTGKVIRVWTESPGEPNVPKIIADCHLIVLNALKSFAMAEDETIIFELDNEIRVEINPSLELKFGPQNLKNPGTILRAEVLRMAECIRPSRLNEPSINFLASGDKPIFIRGVLKEFINAPVRCCLTLESDGEVAAIDLYPSLKPEIPAFDEKDSENYSYGPNIWDMNLGLFPVFEEWFKIKKPRILKK